MKFSDLRLSKPIMRAVNGSGYHTATPIQAQTIPHILDGRDVLGCAQTGTGKTAAFALPVLDRLAANRPKGKRKARCLVLAPTRELAVQISESFRTYGKHVDIYGTVIYGGVSQNPQVQKLRRGVDVIVATPGRLMDLMDQGYVDLKSIETFILDEADRMLDMGFMPDIKRITAELPETKKQTLLFSATMPGEIRRFANELLDNPASVHVAPDAPAAERIEQWVYHVDRRNKPTLLKHLVANTSISRAIVFTRTKHGADKVVRHLRRAGSSAEAIHGDKSQNARKRTLDSFRDGRVHVLVATDIASRGIDVDNISHVINYDLTHEPESYVHRIGRTARAGASGIALSFCDREERGHLRAIQRLIRKEIPVCEDHPEYSRSNEKPAGQTVHYGNGNKGAGKNKNGSKGKRKFSGKAKSWSGKGAGGKGGAGKARRPHRSAPR